MPLVTADRFPVSTRSDHSSRLQADLLDVANPPDQGGCLTAVERLRSTEGAGAVTALADDLRARGEFDLMPATFQAAIDPDPCHQTHRLDGDLMYTVTSFRFSGLSSEAIRRALVDAPWRWWAGGRVQGWTKRPDGSVRFVLWPMWLRSPVSIGMELGPAVPETEVAASGRSRPKLVIDSRFSRSFVGLGRFEIVDVPGAAVLRSVFDGVRPAGLMRLAPSWAVLQVHLQTERGVLPFPFPRGTGYRHLGDHALP